MVMPIIGIILICMKVISVLLVNRDLRWAPTSIPIRSKNLRIRPQGYFFMLRSVLMLLDLETQLKVVKICKKRISKKLDFRK